MLTSEKIEHLNAAIDALDARLKFVEQQLKQLLEQPAQDHTHPSGMPIGHL